MSTRGRIIAGEPVGRTCTLTVQMPSRCTVLTFPSQECPGKWKTKVMITACDVDDPEAKTGEFGNIQYYDHDPTQDELREQIVDMLDHEVRHQLGMDPHAPAPVAEES